MTEISDEVVAAAKQADHEEGVRDGRSYFEVADHQVRRLIAAAVIAERERIYAELGVDHYVIFTEDAWTLVHSADCRLAGDMVSGCTYWTALKHADLTNELAPEMLGRWRIGSIDSEGLPSLVRAEDVPVERHLSPRRGRPA
jgi:hypothetical protein